MNKISFPIRFNEPRQDEHAILSAGGLWSALLWLAVPILIIVVAALMR